MEREAASPRPREQEPRVEVAQAPTRCPYCHDGLEQGALAACRACGARHHAACWREHTCCASCAGGQALVEAEAPETGQEAGSARPDAVAPVEASRGWAVVYALIALACGAQGLVTTLLPLWVVPGYLRIHVHASEWTALLLATGLLTSAWWALAAWCARAARRTWQPAASGDGGPER